MKKTKRMAFTLTIAICLVAMCSAVYATFMVTSSPTAPVTVNYSVTVTEERGFNPTFKVYATVTDNSSDGSSFVKGVPVTFYVNANDAGWTALGTSNTNATGVATYSYSIKSNGETDQFQAAAGIP
jgi:hypothetical protein